MSDREFVAVQETLLETPDETVAMVTLPEEDSACLARWSSSGLLDYGLEFVVAQFFQSERLFWSPRRYESVDHVDYLIYSTGKVFLLGSYLAQGPLTLDQFYDIAFSLCEIMTEVHQKGYLINGIFPDRFVLTDEDTVPRLFTFCYMNEVAEGTTNIPLFSEEHLPYISPEHTGRSGLTVDFRSDYYAMGILFYEMLTGFPPFMGDPLSVVHHHLAQTVTFPDHIQISSHLKRIIHKLCAKDPNDRYQSAVGLVDDLLRARELKGSDVPFELALTDKTSILKPPSCLFAREKEFSVLLKSIDRAQQGAFNGVVVSGQPGIGKSFLFQHAEELLAARGGRSVFVTCPPLEQRTPFGPIFELCSLLVKENVIAASDQGKSWAKEFNAFFGQDAALLAQAVPLLAPFVSGSLDIPELSPEILRRRYLRVLSVFLMMFSDPNSPLLLIIDDLHLADQETLDVLAVMGDSQRESLHLAIWGGYRLDPSQKSLTSDFAFLGPQTKSRVTFITVEGFKEHDITAYLKSLFSRDDVALLSQELMRRSLGNPFSLYQLISAFHQRRLLWFDHQKGWAWDLEKIQADKMPESVVALLTEQYESLRVETQSVVHVASLLGDIIDPAFVQAILEFPKAKIQSAFSQCQSMGIFNPVPGPDGQIQYRFSHDRLRQAGSALFPPEVHKQRQWQIAVLLSSSPIPEQEWQTFMLMVNHFNAGESPDKKEMSFYLAEVNFRAGQQAKRFSAFQLAYNFYLSGLTYLKSESASAHPIAFDLIKGTIESEYWVGKLDESEQRIDRFLKTSLSTLQQGQLYFFKLLILHRKEKWTDAFQVGRHALSLFGIRIPRHKVTLTLSLLFHLAWITILLLWKRPQEIIKQPLTRDQTDTVVQSLLGMLAQSLYIYSQELVGLLLLRIMEATLSRGITIYSSIGFIGYAFVPMYTANYQISRTYAELAVDLDKRFSGTATSGMILSLYHGLLAPWMTPYPICIEGLRHARLAGKEAGDTWFEAASIYFRIFLSLYSSRPLDELRDEMDDFDQFFQKNDLVLYPTYVAYKAVVDTLLSPSVILNREALDFEKYAREFSNEFNAMTHFTTFVMMMNYVGKEFDFVYELSMRIKPLIKHVRSLPVYQDYYLFSSLALFELKKPTLCQSFAQKRVKKRLKRWQDNCPENMAHKYLFWNATCLFKSGKIRPALAMYKEALEKAVLSEAYMYQGLIHEGMMSVFEELGAEELVIHHFRLALKAYQQWGAQSKVEMMKRNYPHYLEERPESKLTSMGLSVSDRVDRLALVRASQVISEELHFETLLSKLLDVLIKNAGAQRGALLINNANSFYLEAESQERGDVQLMAHLSLEDCDQLPKALISQVIQTQESIVCNTQKQIRVIGKEDPYFEKIIVKSLSCLPIKRQGTCVGIVYLENRLVEHAFNSDRLEVIDLLTTQAAISISNAILYLENKDLVENLEKRVEEQLQELQLANKERELSLEMAEKASQQVAYATLTKGIAHEIRNPLAMILSGVELTLDNVENTELVKKFGEVVKQSVIRLRDITTAMLRYGSPVSNPNQQLFLNQLLKDTVLMASVEARKNCIFIHENYHENLPVILGDPSSLGQVCLNLLLNAMQAITGKGDIWIETGFCTFISPDKIEEQGVYLSIRDNGCGISKENIKKIYNPFFSTKYGNTGLGLAIVLRTIAEHHGILDVDSEEGVGTTMSVRLPLRKKPTPEIQARSEIG